VPLLEIVLPAPSRGADAGEAKKLTRAERRREQRSKGKRREPQSGSPWLPLLPAWVGLAVAVTLYFGLRMAVLDQLTSPAPYTTPSLVQTVLGSLGWYVVKAVYPPPQNAFVSGLPGPGFIALGLIAPAAWIGAVIWLRRRAVNWSAELVASGLFFVGIAPAMAIALRSISETQLAERYLYLPSVGICLFAACLAARLAGRLAGGSAALRVALPVVLIAMLAVPAGYATVQRAKVWRNDLAFWTDTSQKSPDQGLPHLHLGIAYSQMGYLDRALAEYQEALAKYDDAEGRSKALNNMGSLYLRQQRWDEAIDSFRRALGEVPVYATAHYNWALAENSLSESATTPADQSQRLQNALAHFEEALRINPRYTKAHLQYGVLLRRLGRADRARGHFQQVIKLDPSSAEAREASRLLQGP
ncbi:MAG: tetratricopeptide repeat protein, partial [Acidobacteriota bacterium]|nr:tetratricopeptide repeat protein [Acidobacteriota bacterium]